MKQILWFRRDLRIEDSAILANASSEVLPLFIFDKNILNSLPKDDKRVTFIYQSVLKLKSQLQKLGLDLAIFYGYPKEILQNLIQSFHNSIDEVLVSCDFDHYAISRDKEIEKMVPLKRFYDSFLIHPTNGLKADGMPYKVFTPFYKNLSIMWESDFIEEYQQNRNLQLLPFDYNQTFTLNDMGFVKQHLPEFLYESPKTLLEQFILKLDRYEKDRDYFSKDATSKLSVHLRFGLISAKQIFNEIKKYPKSEFFIRELFWREFYNYILYYFPDSEFENLNDVDVKWSDDRDKFDAWCEGKTGVPIIDAAMRYLNETGLMHNRLRMVVASFLTKNLFLPWQWGEKYFALKLLDYEKSSNVGSWQWGASTGADSAPYFRVFNPYSQSEKFDKDGKFIQSVLKELQEVEPKLLHKENGVQSDMFIDYPKSIVDIKASRAQAIQRFKDAK